MKSQPDRESDVRFMRLAIREAARGIGKTAPNPAVGAVIVKNGRVLAKGYHHAAGQPHAEIEALRKLGTGSWKLEAGGKYRNSTLTDEIRGQVPQLPSSGATLFVTLEPCSSHGRTPPCTEAIIAAGITRVVYGATDPDPRHRGRGAKLLRKAGIAVTEGILVEECSSLNSHWNHRLATGLPWVIAKAGMSLDARLDSPSHRRWITSPASRREAMRLRASVEAILVGGGTVRADNPALTIRGVKFPKEISQEYPQPRRVIWSRSGNLPRKAQVFTDEHREHTQVFTGMSLKKALQELARQGISSVLIEGGGQTLGEAFDKNLVDEIRFFIAPVIQGGNVPSVGGRGAASDQSAFRLAEVSYKAIGSDVMVSGKVEKRG